jgi:class 3 adenylate cyclase
MVTFIQYKDPESKELAHDLKELQTCPGTCFFIDLNQSTAMKYKLPFTEWARQLNNTFSFISFLNDFPDNIVKGIGDEIMLFIPDDVLKAKSSYTTYYAILEEVYSTLFNIRNYPRHDIFLKCKVAIHYCTDVYNITFFKGANDYYGIDIDLTARLMSKSKENRIVLSERFYTKVMEDVHRMGIPPDSGCLAGISGKFHEQFHGVPVNTEFRVIDVV